MSDLDYHSPKTYIALSIFLFCWMMFARNWPSFPIGRTVAAVLGGSLMVTFQVITGLEAFQSVSGGTMLLLVGLMVILAILEEKGVTQPLKALLLMGNPSPRMLLARVSVTSAILGALIMNDGAAIFLTSVVLDIVEEYDLLIEPFALAVATSANVGSAATVLGNPKNMLVQEKVPGLTFMMFAKRMAPIAFVCTMINTGFLLVYYWSDVDGEPLNATTNPDKSSSPQDTQDEVDEDVLAMEQEYLQSKQAQPDLDELPPLSHPAVATENTPLNQSLEFCPELTETPQQYQGLQDHHSTIHSFSEWFRSRSPTHLFGHTKQLRPDDDNDSIMSPAESFRDLDRLEYLSIPKYDWPTQPRSKIGSAHPGTDALGLEILATLIRSPKEQKPSFLSLYLRPILLGLTLILMYAGFMWPLDLGWTCLTAAMVMVAIEGRDGTSLLAEHVNWSLLCYLFGVFAVLKGVGKTPLPKQLWKSFAPIINPTTPNLAMSTLGFSMLVVILSFMFTSIPTVLLVSPYLKDLTDPRLANSAWFLLAWSVTLCGNLTAFGSVAGLIVSEICKDYTPSNPNPTKPTRRTRPNRWVGEFSVWTGFTWWSTITILLVGAGILVLT